MNDKHILIVYSNLQLSGNIERLDFYNYHLKYINISLSFSSSPPCVSYPFSLNNFVNFFVVNADFHFIHNKIESSNSSSDFWVCILLELFNY